MSKVKNNLVVTVSRDIAAKPTEAFKAWLNPKVPGTPWYEGDKLLLNPKVNGFFYWYISKAAKILQPWVLELP